MSYFQQRAKMNHTLDRDGAYKFRTPTESDRKCDYFEEHFIEVGAMRERRAICDMHEERQNCDYLYTLEDGTPLCLRYWYGPFYEKDVAPLPPKEVQKRNDIGALLYWQDDGTGIKVETTTVTDEPVMVLLHDQYPVPYVVANMEPELDDSGSPLYWDRSVDPAVKTTTDTGEPVMLKKQDEWYSTQYIDTHGKVFSTQANQLGWRHKV